MTEIELLENCFSKQRISKYRKVYPTDDERVEIHYRANLRVAESFYISLSVFEVTLRNALSRELENMTGRKDWYSIFSKNSVFKDLDVAVERAIKQITCRGEIVNSDKIISELTFGFWVMLLNQQYENELWKSLRKSFPYMPKTIRQRKNISAPCNTFRHLRNRVFHHEAICWDLDYVTKLHSMIVMVLGWMNKEIPVWLQQIDRFDMVMADVRKELEQYTPQTSK